MIMMMIIMMIIMMKIMTMIFFLDIGSTKISFTSARKIFSF